MTFNVYRDGRVHVLDDMCSTCIFRPGNLMHLSRGRVREMVEAAAKDESFHRVPLNLGHRCKRRVSRLL